MIVVIRPGNFTTIQDSGRWGYQTWGMPISGCLDPYAAQVANLLVGNKKYAAMLEMTDEGGVFHFDYSVMAAIAGADMQATLNGRSLHNWQSFIVPAGGTLAFGKAVSGRRSYLAVQGGIEVAPVMGSRSTYVAAGIGGLDGRILMAGDMLEIGNDAQVYLQTTDLSEFWVPKYRHAWKLNVILGPQADLFNAANQKKFLSSTYKVSSIADRMACELEGPAVILQGRELVSDATGWGAVEIPAHGQPFIVMPDHGTTRGFAKIGYVIQANLYKLAQAMPGDTISFVEIDTDTAIDLYKLQQADYQTLAKSFRTGQMC
ncbi:MAG: biotin-dependent carboxyltransferase family protein [Acidaminococcaceae bacterium]|nr:biotin-dependent carboxyltransferase family protein [Acidaminococcaceae bacterium]MDD4722363.1 biotin-dependent carboxyltransferase family protein [Acidaminococcaceae bacterium]